MDKARVNELKQFATEIRIATMKEFKTRGFGHVGGALSVVDTLSVLYGGEMKIDPKNPNWDGRDRMIMSKGHAGPAVYATLALKGYFPLEWLDTLNVPGTKQPSHCDRNKTPGVDMTTGSLGQGASMAVGIALGLKLDEKPNYVYLFVGDGESNEGQVWESVMFAAQHKLSNLITFVDYNGKQLDGTTEEIMDLGDFAAKFREFGWHAQTVSNNDVEAIAEAIAEAKKVNDKPSCIVLKGLKGAGVKSVEDVEYNHHINISAESADSSISVLENEMAALKGGAVK